MAWRVVSLPQTSRPGETAGRTASPNLTMGIPAGPGTLGRAQGRPSRLLSRRGHGRHHVVQQQEPYIYHTIKI
ncbi:hypothetical protein E2C01_055524 [Portunus trituberculatus]|uniref:Uncharacterized protein n=1 Tax=Portunus trituberculatus TaxID=210409 RepID=A0A5B7GRF9_PORTR|nr:hypothetical protein [Portunus trituberculatus]